MPNDEFSQEELLSHLSHRPRYILNGVISVEESAKLSLSKVQRTCQSSIGRLDKLPLELLHATLSYLDLQTLSYFLRVSLSGKAIVESLPAYRDLLSSAGHVFPILKRTRAIHLHSVATLHAALHSDRCASCGNFGAFLSLLASERCCFACLSRNQSLWMVTPTFARDCFDLTRQEAKALPVMRSIPGRYFVRRRISRLRSVTLTSVKAAKELALKFPRSTQDMARNIASPRMRPPDPRKSKFSWFQAAPLQPLSKDPLTLKDDGPP